MEQDEEKLSKYIKSHLKIQKIQQDQKILDQMMKELREKNENQKQQQIKLLMTDLEKTKG